ncbi:hypothetical protein V2J09_007591 [Rumex salicifolius]
MESIGGDDALDWETQSHGSAPREREEKIQVSVRLRPLNEKEITSNDFADWDCINNTTIVFKNVIGERTMYPNAYSYDRVFGTNCSTREVYDEAAKEVALSVVNGINSSIFAYGQTSSGKTFTMSGVTQYTIEDIYCYIEKHKERNFVLKFSAMEIYNESVRDLLSADATPLRLLDDPERGTVVERLTEETLKDKTHLLELLAYCQAQRQTGETALNETSSRSHQILRLIVESSVQQLVGVANSSTLSATVNFVDLAGSERTSQTMSAGTRLKEGCHINRSLLTLGTVIRKLSKGRNGHVPYRDSKLTRILQHSLGGNAKTAIICTLSPAHSHLEQSRNTLLFATCAKEVSTNARVNVVMSDKALVKQLRKELVRLEGELKSMSGANYKGDVSAKLKEKEMQIEKMAEEIKELSYQRDIAQAQIEELLQSSGQQQILETKDPLCRPVHHRRKISWAEDSSVESDMSDYQRLDADLTTIGSFNYNGECNEINICNQDSNLLDNSKGQFLTDEYSPHFTNRSQELLVTEQRDAEDNCKEVQCISVEEVTTNRKSETREMANLPNEEDNTKEIEPNHSSSEYDILVNRIKELQSTIDNLVNRQQSDYSPYSTESEMSSVRGFNLLRSRSCRAIIASSSPGYGSFGHRPDMLFDGFERQSVGRPKNLPRPHTLNCSNSVKSPKTNTTSIRNALLREMDQEIRTFDASDEATQVDFQEKLRYDVDGYPLLEVKIIEHQQKRSQENGKGHNLKSDEQAHFDWSQEFKRQDERLKISTKDVVQGNIVSPSSPLQDFDQQRRKIIKLWDSCHTSIVHRSCFFLLFKGTDPSDSIYMEVELRRVSFIQSKFSEGAKIIMDGQILTPTISLKALNQEREMLSKQMQRKFTVKEREALFKNWGIGLDTKRRRLQLARCLWNDSEDMENIRESATLVAKLCGFNDGGEVPKEMFVGPNFTKALNKRSYSWKDSLTSLIQILRVSWRRLPQNTKSKRSSGGSPMQSKTASAFSKSSSAVSLSSCKTYCTILNNNTPEGNKNKKLKDQQTSVVNINLSMPINDRYFACLRFM